MQLIANTLNSYKKEQMITEVDGTNDFKINKDKDNENIWIRFVASDKSWINKSDIVLEKVLPEIRENYNNQFVKFRNKADIGNVRLDRLLNPSHYGVRMALLFVAPSYKAGHLSNGEYMPPFRYPAFLTCLTELSKQISQTAVIHFYKDDDNLYGGDWNTITHILDAFFLTNEILVYSRTPKNKEVSRDPIANSSTP